MKYIDVLVDGRFILEKKDLSLPYCGSSNQRVIDVPKSLKSGEVVLWKDPHIVKNSDIRRREL